jgi:hypothetical protein
MDGWYLNDSRSGPSIHKAVYASALLLKRSGGKAFDISRAYASE